MRFGRCRQNPPRLSVPAPHNQGLELIVRIVHKRLEYDRAHIAAQFLFNLGRRDALSRRLCQTLPEQGCDKISARRPPGIGDVHVYPAEFAIAASYSRGAETGVCFPGAAYSGFYCFSSAILSISRGTLARSGFPREHTPDSEDRRSPMAGGLRINRTTLLCQRTILTWAGSGSSGSSGERCAVSLIGSYRRADNHKA